MRTLTRRLRPHVRASWLTFAAVAALTLLVSILVVELTGGGRVALVMTAFTWFVLTVASAAVLDAILVPGNSDVRRQAGHAAGWTGALGVGGGFAHGGGGHGGAGDGGGSC